MGGLRNGNDDGFSYTGEKELFFLINGLHSPWLDNLMWLYSGIKIWVPVAVGMIFFLVYKKNWREWIGILGLLMLLVLACDFVSGELIKPWFGRPWPTSFPGIMEQVRTLGERRLDTVNYGFV
ncbi:MAG: hypothetical protein LUD68_00895, partial [Rikenellaceae bacterium]|nr:hypothetical protein [Rikenellaceae bacterium]